MRAFVITLRSLLRVSALACLGAVLAALTVLTGGAAQAASGSTGSVQESGVTCYLDPDYPQNNRVIVQAPAMSSSPATQTSNFTVGGTNGGGFHVQRVSYQAVLYRWDGSQWAYAAAGPVITGNAFDQVQPVRWDEGESSTWFNTSGHGAYAVFLRYTWDADSQSAGGHDGDWARVYEQGRASYCSF